MRGAELKRHDGSHRASQSQSDRAAAMGSLSDLLLALQDELGHMSLWVTGLRNYVVNYMLNTMHQHLFSTVV